MIGPARQGNYVVAGLMSWVIVVIAVAALSFGLERENSANTLALVTLIGTVMISPVLIVVVKLLMNARQDASDVKDGVEHIKESLNGGFEPRVGGVVDDRIAPVKEDVRQLKSDFTRFQESQHLANDRMQTDLQIVKTMLAHISQSAQEKQ
jgi:signal transduction histidine kinase